MLTAGAAIALLTAITMPDVKRTMLAVLPQEVKELGKEQAIIFYEGLKPIQCRKIRYFSDRQFKARLRPPPTRVAPMMEEESLAPVDDSVTDTTDNAVIGEAASDTSSTLAPTGVAESTRDATLDDIEHIDSLTLEEFATDFDKVQLPDSDKLTEQELKTAAESFLSTLREC